MGNPKGSRFEKDLLKFFREEGIDAEHLRLTGKEDEGDLLLRLTDRRLVIEAKNRARMDLAGWISEAVEEACNYGSHRGIERPHFAVVHKRRSKGAGYSYVTLPLYEYLEQIR